ncbi:MAG: MFS transporter [Cyanobacteria bacterium P01_C01_bin.69]
MKVFRDLEPALRRNLIIFFCASLCFWAGLAGMLPNLSLYIESFGASNQEIGWVMAAFAIGLLGLRPRMSQFIDNKGRKPALLIGIVVIAIAPLLYLSVSLAPNVLIDLPKLAISFNPDFSIDLSQTTQVKSSILLLAAARAFHGISIAAFATAYTASVADMAPPHQRGELIGYMSLASPVGMALGPALGGYLEGSFTFAFLTMTLLGVVGTLCVFLTKEPTRHVVDGGTSPTEDNQPKKKPLFWSLLLTAPIRVPALILFMVGTAFGTMVAFIPLHVRELGIEVNIGLIYTVSAIASFSIRALAGRASDQLGRGRFISMGLIFYTLAMFTLSVSTNAPMLLLAGAFQGAGGGTLIPIIAALMADRSRPGERGITFGLCLTGFDLGIALAGPIMGRIADASTYSLVFAIAGCMTLSGLLVFVTNSSKDVPHSVRFALNGGRDVYAVK